MSENIQQKSRVGGKREGSGRKLGSASKKTREIANKAAESGLTPLEYMLQILQDFGAEPAIRLDAAKSAAPYIHPRLSAVEHSGDLTIRTLSQELAELNDANTRGG
jgi:hypothetical protein